MAWIGLYRPTEDEMAAVAAEFGLHSLAVEDAISAHQRPKLERYDDILFTVLRPARYLDATETVEFGELHVFTGEELRRHRPARRNRRGGTGAAETGAAPRPPVPRPGGCALRPDGPGGGRLRPRRGGAGERHRRDRGPAVQRRLHGLAADLRAGPRGHPVPARHPPAPGHDAAAPARLREVPGQLRAPAQPPRRRGPRGAADLPRRFLPGPPAERPHPRRHTDGQPAERGQRRAERAGQENLVLGGHLLRPVNCRRHLRHEL